MTLRVLASFIVIWGIMMNILHPLAHAMTLASPSSTEHSISIVYFDSHYSLGSETHHDEDFGNEHCDVCHISVTAFILFSTSLGHLTTSPDSLLSSLSIPTGYQPLSLDQPPRFIA